jgi:hypothetical protein
MRREDSRGLGRLKEREGRQMQACQLGALEQPVQAVAGVRSAIADASDYRAPSFMRASKLLSNPINGYGKLPPELARFRYQ